MRIVCFAKSKGEAASTRQRALGFLEAARAEGWETAFRYAPAYPRWNVLPVRWGRFLGHWLALRRVDKQTVVFLQRTLRSPEFLWLVPRYRGRAGMVVSDFDDAVWVHSPRDTARIVALSDQVWCGSRHILEHFLAAGAPARFVPTTVETARFAGLPRREEAVPVVGWVGDGGAHRRNLAAFAKTLAGIHADLPPFRLRLIGVKGQEAMLREAFSFLGDRLELTPWLTGAEVPDAVSRFSVGVMPLLADAFNQGKSALKLIEYLAAGVPVIASDVGENRHVVQPPAHGFLAADDAGWKQALAALLSDADRCRAMGEAGRTFACATYDRAAVYGPLLRELRDALSAPSPASPRGA